MDFVFPDSRSDRYNKGKIIGPVLYLVHTFCSWWFWAIVLKTERISSNFKCHTYLAHPLFGMDSRTHTLQPLRYRFHEWLFTRARNPRYLIDLREGGCQFKMKFGCVNTHPVLSRCTWCFNLPMHLKSYGWYVAFDLGIFRNVYNKMVPEVAGNAQHNLRFPYFP